MAKLLIVDDEAATVDMLSTYLGLIGHETVGAFSGEEGLASVYTEKPDLLILDLMMPDLEGFDVCKQLRESGDYTTLPILIISARFDQQSIDRAMSLGADVYLTKPIDLPKLTSEIIRLVENPPDHSDRVKKAESEKAESGKPEPESKASDQPPDSKTSPDQ